MIFATLFIKAEKWLAEKIICLRNIATQLLIDFKKIFL